MSHPRQRYSRPRGAWWGNLGRCRFADLVRYVENRLALGHFGAE